tara:strand:- start:272 stop:406 length:135 start_codon:yes stop_codon:yes gene_type:complete
MGMVFGEFISHRGDMEVILSLANLRDVVRDTAIGAFITDMVSRL